ncbi:MAG: glycosyltransferase family 2 protein [Altererythrobacter sp.]|nr:glycosyltransferase family 2 protein [Altererythrobacter sp.]OJU59502.1 MAG: dolichol monophosphate mannose synthase [Altererythrobacter sp. 66-12]
MEMSHSSLEQALTAASRPLELAVVLPTFNEAANIAPMVRRLEAALGPSGWEAIFVDDDSHDGTADAVRAISRADPRIRVIQRFGRRGLASAAIEGVCATAAPIVAVMDADLQHDPALLPAMLDAVRSGQCDIAVASRFVEGASMEAWNRPDRERASALANRLARKVTGVTLTDPMSGFFMLRTETVLNDAHRLSGIGFKILLDILATVERPLVVKEFPMAFGARAAGESKLDRTVVFEFLVGLYDKWLGRIIPTRFALFGTIGAMGVLVHMAVLSAFLATVGGSFRDHLITDFEIGQTLAALVAMSFNFVLNNSLTYADQRLKGAGPLLRGWFKFALTCSVGLLANVGVAAVLVRMGMHTYPAALSGIVVGSVWNYALSSRFVWGRFK